MPCINTALAKIDMILKILFSVIPLLKDLLFLNSSHTMSIYISIIYIYICITYFQVGGITDLWENR